jgi:hypothetical protein
MWEIVNQLIAGRPPESEEALKVKIDQVPRDEMEKTHGLSREEGAILRRLSKSKQPTLVHSSSDA